MKIIFYAAEESRFEFSLPLMSACPETTTRGTDDVRAETKRKEMALLQKVTGISRSVGVGVGGEGDLEKKTKICQKSDQLFMR